MFSIRSPPWVIGGRGKEGLEVLPEGSCQSVPGRSHWGHSGALSLGNHKAGTAGGVPCRPEATPRAQEALTPAFLLLQVRAEAPLKS